MENARERWEGANNPSCCEVGDCFFGGGGGGKREKGKEQAWSALACRRVDFKSPQGTSGKGSGEVAAGATGVTGGSSAAWWAPVYEVQAY